MKKNKNPVRVILVAVAIIVVIAIPINFWIAIGTQEVVTVSVTGKERITESDSEGRASSKYLVFTENETFENTDSIMVMKWNSSDIQGKLVEGEEFRIKVYGFRIPFFSSYRNIIEVIE